MKRLPLGIQDFSRLAKGNYVYIDKTKLIYELADTEFNYFLSRPRRFGKSLLVSTLKALFEGKKELFQGTWLEQSSYDWAEYPVISIDFSFLANRSSEKLVLTMQEYLQAEAKRLDAPFTPSSELSMSLFQLVTGLSRRGPVVILIDEYDAPLVRKLNNHSLVEENKEILRDFFTAIKALQSHIRFAFFTGVSKFSKVSLFSGMNSLLDLSLDPKYATLLGWTEKEIQTALTEHINASAKKRGVSDKHILDEMRDWYNGYAFALDAEKVFNPWSVLNYFNSNQLKNYWFETATPTFAVNLIKNQAFPVVDLENGVRVGEEILANQGVDTITIPSLLFQTGYLTIAGYDQEDSKYILRIPNEEVRQSLVKHLFSSFIEGKDKEAEPILTSLKQALASKNMDDFFHAFNRFFAAVPYLMHRKQENCYHSWIFLCLKMLGFPTRAELETSRGRIDLVVSTQDTLFLFEFKMNQSAAIAMEQIKKMDYSLQFQKKIPTIILVGANFDSATRSINEWEVEELLT